MVCNAMKLDATKLTTARLAKGMSQQQVADECTLSVATISNAENGKDLWPATAKVICDFYGLVLGEVMLPITDEGRGDAA